MAKKAAELQSEGYQTWVKARTAKDFNAFSPILKEWVDLVKARCELIKPGEDAFNTSLDEYERGMTAERLDEIFPVVKTCVVDLIKRVYEKESPVSLKKGENVVSGGTFDVETQAKLSKEIALKLGFDLEKGRLDVSVHPFTGRCGPGDVRMTTRYKENDLSEGLTGTIHETGHALYEQGRNVTEYANQPVSRAHSMGVHESQSLLWERMVALSPPFSTFLLPELKKSFPKEFESVTEAQLHASLNVVRNPSVIRVEADELTYPLHILLRTELEIGLMRGEIAIDDLPKLWNEKMKQYLDVDIEDDSRGGVAGRALVIGSVRILSNLFIRRNVRVSNLRSREESFADFGRRYRERYVCAASRMVARKRPRPGKRVRFRGRFVGPRDG